jgi:DNA-binding NarL/FixJ family response regulator
MLSRDKSNKIKVLLCDDHAMVREGTRMLLEGEPDIEVVGEAEDGAMCVELAGKLSPHVIAMDVSMPRMNGIEATRIIKEKHPEILILALTAYDDFAYVSRLIESGASGYILKNAKAEELILAIKTTAMGDSVLDPKVACEVFRRIAKHVPAGTGEEAISSRKLPKEIDALTDKELQVIRLAAGGYSNKEIAGKLNISPRTVQSHLTSIFNKLGVNSRTQAVISALKLQIITQDEIKEATRYG